MIDWERWYYGNFLYPFAMSVASLTFLDGLMIVSAAGLYVLEMGEITHRRE